MDIQTGNVFRENQYGRNTEQISTTSNVQSVPKTENPLSSLVEGQYFRGTILDVQPLGNDIKLEIMFDTYGKKLMMANFAKLY